jgi:hypothetical protein
VVRNLERFRKEVDVVTIIELNIAGLHLTRSAPSRRAVKRTWQRNYRAIRQSVKTGHWPRRATDSAAA